MQMESILNLAADLGAVGFILWLAHRLTAVTIPQITESYTVAVEKQRDDFRETLEKQRTDFANLHTRQAEMHERRVQAVMDKCVNGRMGGPHDVRN